MSAFRLPGPLCTFFRALKIDSGTLCRSASPVPGSAGISKPFTPTRAAPANNPAFSDHTNNLATELQESNSSADATSTNLRVVAGQVTFDAEGNDNPASPYFSRVVHWPGNSLSGVTIGRGYDLGSRLRDVVYNDLIGAGVGSREAQTIAEGAGLKGGKASDFVKANKSKIGEISYQQQVKLFDRIYPSYVARARENYDSWTLTGKNRVPWDDLLPKIRDILVDFVYQGFTKGPNPMKAGMTNDVGTLIHYIESTTALIQYEPGRKRAAYLRS